MAILFTNLVDFAKTMLAFSLPIYAICANQHKSCEFESHSWRGILDTTLSDKVVSDLQQVNGFLRYYGFLHQ
jgi:hypothetical protein